MLAEEFRAIAELSGAANKRAYLKQLCEDMPLAKRVLWMTYNPDIKFNYLGKDKYGEGDAVVTADTLDALPNVDIRMYTYEEGELIKRILEGNLRIGIAVKGINKIWPGFIPTHDVMLAKKLEWHRVKYPCWATLKLDGVRAIYRGGVFRFRNGKVIPGLDHLTDALVAARVDCIDCELLVPGVEFNTSSGMIRSHSFTPQAHAYIIDLPYMDDRFIARIAEAEKISKEVKKVHVIPAWGAQSQDYILRKFAEVTNQGHEGLVVKPFNYKYVAKRSFSWMKMKLQHTVDLTITGVFEGTGKFAGSLGGFICMHNGKAVSVGSGFSDIERVRYWLEPPIGQVCEVKYHEETSKGSLRHPIFVRMRDDKC